MKAIVPVIVAALAGLFALGSGKASAAGPSKVPAPTSKSVAQRMAEVLATKDPNAIRFEAGRLRQEGHPSQAAELEREAQAIEAQIAAGQRPPPVYTPPAKTPVKLPGATVPSASAQPLPLPSVVISPSAPTPSMPLPFPTITVVPPTPQMPPISLPGAYGPPAAPVFVPLPVLPAGLILKNGAASGYPAPASSGPLVQQWQQKLLSLGFTVGSKGADGKFGPDTELATKLFQTAANVAAAQSLASPKPKALTVDGKVGPATLARAASASTSPSGPRFGGYPPYPVAASPLPGLVAPMAPGDVDPRRALVARVVTDLLTCPPGEENKSLVAVLQAQEGEKASGYYGPGLAAKIATRYGVIPPKPLYWPQTARSKSKSNYRAQLAELGKKDPQRAEEWLRAANV